jgi:hypothetical protein
MAALQSVRVDIGVARLDVLHGAMNFTLGTWKGARVRSSLYTLLFQQNCSI